MHTLAVLVLLGACAGPLRPAVTPKLSELPLERERRDAILDSANTSAGPEHRPSTSRKFRKVETTAATAAAVLGWLLSDSENVTFGVGGPIGVQLDREPARPSKRDRAREPEAASDPAVDEREPELVPWIRLKDQPREGTIDEPPASPR